MIKTILIAALTITPGAFALDATKPGDLEPSEAVIRQFSKFDTIIDNEVRAASQTRASDPLRFIARDMKTCVGELSEYHTDQPVQVKQGQVVSQLDTLIKMLEEQCKKSGVGGSLNPSRPMADSKLGGGPGGIHELTDPKAAGKEWGKLPPKQREQILQSKTDGFPAGYDALLQSYYKRLAQEQVTQDSSSGAGSTSNTTAAPTTAPSSP